MAEESNIYVVDDDSSSRKGLARLLRAAGYNVHSFDSAICFLDSLISGLSGCLILDLRMPEMSGEELASELRTRETNVNIIVVSGNDDLETRKIAKSIGAVGFFRKPVDGTALIDAIAWTLKAAKENNH